MSSLGVYDFPAEPPAGCVCLRACLCMVGVGCVCLHGSAHLSVCVDTFLGRGR